MGLETTLPEAQYILPCHSCTYESSWTKVNLMSKIHNRKGINLGRFDLKGLVSRQSLSLYPFCCVVWSLNWLPMQHEPLQHHESSYSKLSQYTNTHTHSPHKYQTHIAHIHRAYTQHTHLLFMLLLFHWLLATFLDRFPSLLLSLVHLPYSGSHLLLRVLNVWVNSTVLAKDVFITLLIALIHRSLCLHIVVCARQWLLVVLLWERACWTDTKVTCLHTHTHIVLWEELKSLWAFK